VVVVVDDVVAAFEFVGTMAVVVVGLACVFVGMVVIVGSTAVVTAAAAAGATNGADGAVARKEARVPGGDGPASDASPGNAAVGKVAAAAAPTAWRINLIRPLSFINERFMREKSSAHCLRTLPKV